MELKLALMDMSDNVLRATFPVVNNKFLLTKAYEILPNVSYKLLEYTYTEAPRQDGKKLFFHIYDNYYDADCTSDHEEGEIIDKPRLVMETPGHPRESKAPGENFKFVDLQDKITFHIEAKPTPCQLCNMIWLHGVLVEYCDDGSVYAGYQTDVPLVLQPSE